MRKIFFLFAFILAMGANVNQTSVQFATPAMAAEEVAEGSYEFEYLELKPLMIPVIGRNGITQQVSFVVSLEVPTGNLDRVSRYEPRLADAYIQDLYGVLGTGYGLVNGRVLDVPTIKKRMHSVAARVLGDDMVNDVLLQVVQQRPL